MLHCCPLPIADIYPIWVVIFLILSEKAIFLSFFLDYFTFGDFCIKKILALNLIIAGCLLKLQQLREEGIRS